MSMVPEVVILIAEDDLGHARLIQKNIERVGLRNPIIRFENGQDLMDFLVGEGPGPHREPDTPYLLLLDIRMPKLDGIEALSRIKREPRLRKIPVVMLTTTDDPREVERCHDLGCNNYIVKPVDYDKFADAIKQLGMFIALVQIPEIHDHR